MEKYSMVNLQVMPRQKGFEHKQNHDRAHDHWSNVKQHGE